MDFGGVVIGMMFDMGEEFIKFIEGMIVERMF